MKPPIGLVERTKRGLVSNRGLHGFAPDHALQAEIIHQPLELASCNAEAFTLDLRPHLPSVADTEVLGEQVRHLGLTVESF